jgi:phosphatidylserine decarboxylase
MNFRFAKESLKLALPAFVLSVVFFFVNSILFLICLGFFLFTLYFFRDPYRDVVAGPNEIVSPADGKVIQIKEAERNHERFQLVSIFMSPLNVHINYAPMDGKIEDIQYQKGRFLMAGHVRASVENEANCLRIQGQNLAIYVNQIAGVLARRIICYNNPGDFLKKGQKFGLIQFGSRVDLYLPFSVKINVQVGDKVKGALTVIGVVE